VGFSYLGIVDDKFSFGGYRVGGGRGSGCCISNFVLWSRARKRLTSIFIRRRIKQKKYRKQHLHHCNFLLHPTGETKRESDIKTREKAHTNYQKRQKSYTPWVNFDIAKLYWWTDSLIKNATSRGCFVEVVKGPPIALIPDIPPEEYHHAIKMPTHSLNNLCPASPPPTTN